MRDGGVMYSMADISTYSRSSFLLRVLQYQYTEECFLLLSHFTLCLVEDAAQQLGGRVGGWGGVEGGAGGRTICC